jgi:citrate synthase
MQRKKNMITSDMGWSSSDRIVVRGKDLPSELLGHVSFGDMAFFEVMGRLPNVEESSVFNSLLVTLVEHGMTPSALAARLTYLGAPESLQGAVAAGILGVGSVFVGTVEGAARMLQESIGPDTDDGDLPSLAESIVGEYRSRNKAIPGIGHPVHKPADPRVARLFEIAEQNHFRGQHVRLMELVAADAEVRYGRSLPLNATGAIGALLNELGFPAEVARGLGAMARAVGLVGHIWEEIQRPIAREIWYRVEDEVSEHANPTG